MARNFTRGCLACHSLGEGDSKAGGNFAANLQRVGEKSNLITSCAGFTIRAMRVAPYCPKENAI